MKPQEHNDIEFEDVNKTGASSSFRDIVLSSFKKATEAGSLEMSPGGVQVRLINGEAVAIVVPNQPEIFCNSVEMLRLQLEPKAKEYANITKQLTDIDERMKQLNTKKENLINRTFERTKRNMESPSSIIRSVNYERELGQYQQRFHKIKEIEDNYERERLMLFRDTLKVLSFLLYEMRYFDEGGAAA